MPGFGDIVRIAGRVLKSKKTQEAIRSERGQQITGRVLDGAEGVAGRVTGGKHDDTIAKARAAADAKLGRRGQDGTPTKRPSPPE